MSDEMNGTEIEEIANAAAQIRDQWDAVIQAVVAACNGDDQATVQLTPFLNEMAQQDDWRTLVAVFRRILAGEREPVQLLAGLDDTDTLIVSDILRALGVNPQFLPSLLGEEPEDDDGNMVSLEEFMQMVTVACTPGSPPEMQEHLLNATRGMTMQADAPPEIQELGRVLTDILSGERNPDLSTLHPQLMDRIQQMLADLRGHPASST
jgi:hypothetical protein